MVKISPRIQDNFIIYQWPRVSQNSMTNSQWFRWTISLSLTCHYCAPSAIHQLSIKCPLWKPCVILSNISVQRIWVLIIMPQYWWYQHVSVLHCLQSCLTPRQWKATSVQPFQLLTVLSQVSLFCTWGIGWNMYFINLHCSGKCTPCWFQMFLGRSQKNVYSSECTPWHPFYIKCINIY